MNSNIVKRGLLTTAFVVCVAAAGHAQTIEVTVPFPFLVHGTTLPAGQYRVEAEGSVVLIRGEHGNQAAMFVGTTPAPGHDPSGDQPALMFTRYETQYRLADIWESGSEGLAIDR